MGYDDAYLRTPALFGQGPGPLLKRYFAELDDTSPVLDLGCGQGRHSLFLARSGHRVEAVDPSQVAVDFVARVARAEALPLRVRRGGFESVEAEEGSYGAALVFGLIQILSREETSRLVASLRRWVAPGGLVFVTAFSVADPRYEALTAAWEPVSRHEWRTPDGEPRVYLEPDEILKIFDGWTVVHHWEGLGPEHCHGDGEPERHGRVEVVLRR